MSESSVPFIPSWFDEDVNTRNRRIGELEDSELERTGFDPDYEAWLSHIPAEWWGKH